MSLLSDLGTKIGTELKSLWNVVNGKADKTTVFEWNSDMISGDLNDLKRPQARRVNPEVANLPTLRHHSVMVYGNSGNVTGQIATDFQNGESYIRAFNNDWSAWRKVWDSSNFNPSSKLDVTNGRIEVSDSISAENGTIRIGDGFGTGGSSTIHKLNNDLYLQFNNGLSETNLILGGGSTKCNVKVSPNGSTYQTVIGYDGTLYSKGSTVMTGNKTISTSAPSGGSHGDIWIQV